jgi:hypothetical protein
MLKGVMQLVIIASFMVRVFPIRELKPGFIGGGVSKPNTKIRAKCTLKDFQRPIIDIFL